MTEARAEQLRALLADVDARILLRVEATTRLTPEAIAEIGALEATRTALWRLLAADEAPQRT